MRRGELESADRDLFRDLAATCEVGYLSLVTADGPTKHEGYTTDIITEEVLRWVEARDEDRPFALMCHHKAPHRSWEPSRQHFSLFDGIDIPEPATLFDDYAGRGTPARTPGRIPPRDARHSLSAGYAWPPWPQPLHPN